MTYLYDCIKADGDDLGAMLGITLNQTDYTWVRLINIKLKESKKRKRNDSEDWIISEKRRKPSDYDMLTLEDREKLLKRTFENLESLEDIISFSSNSNRFDMLNNSKFEKLYKAETYHQDYYENNFIRYLMYKKGCQREETLKKIRNYKHY